MYWRGAMGVGAAFAGLAVALTVYGKEGVRGADAGKGHGQGQDAGPAAAGTAEVDDAEHLPAADAAGTGGGDVPLREARCAPFGPDRPSVRVELPPAWTWTPAQVEPGSPYPRWHRAAVARGSDAADAGLTLTVRTALLTREVSLFEVVLREMEVRHLAILDRRGPPRFGPVACMDLVVRGRPGGRPVLARIRAYKDGPCLVLVEVEGPEAAYRARRAMLERMAAAAALVNPTVRPYAEELAGVSLPGPARLATEVPVSFRSDRADAQRPGQARVRLCGPGDPRYAGYLELAALDKAAFPMHTVEILVYNEMQRIGQFGATIEDLRAERDLGPTSRFGGPGKFCVYACLKDGVECEAVIQVRSSERAWVALTLFGPARREAPELWMANRRAMDIADHLLREE